MWAAAPDAAGGVGDHARVWSTLGLRLELVLLTALFAYLLSRVLARTVPGEWPAPLAPLQSYPDRCRLASSFVSWLCPAESLVSSPRWPARRGCTGYEGQPGEGRRDVVSWNTMIDAYAKQGDIAGAERALARMEQKGVAADVVSYSTVIDAYAKEGDIAGAERALARMEQKGVAANVVSYSTAIDAYAKRGTSRPRSARWRGWSRRVWLPLSLATIL